MIYAMPALDTAILEIDPNAHTVTRYGMLPHKGMLTDKWNGGVLAPNGRICKQHNYPARNVALINRTYTQVSCE